MQRFSNSSRSDYNFNPLRNIAEQCFKDSEILCEVILGEGAKFSITRAK